jgi:sortase A
MAVGLLLILSVGGYFAWSEVQAAQVQAELDASAAQAAQRATAVALKESEPQQVVAAAAATATPTTRPTRAPTETPAAQATRAATSTEEPTPRPTSTPAPTATRPPLPPVRIAIPDLKIDAKVVDMGWEVVQTKSGPVSQWVIPKNAAGHHVNSAAMGESGNLVISGHNNIYGRVFMAISQAWNNDKAVKVDAFTEKSDALTGREILLYAANGEPRKYVITEFYRLKDTGVSNEQRIKNGRFILPTDDERVTIITCWPPTNNTHRLAVIAKPES